MLAKILFSSKLVLVLLLIFLGFLGNIKYKQWKEQNAIENEKQLLVAQIDSLEKKSEELSKSLEYLNSKNYKEKAARQELNMKREGEVVYNFSSNEGEKVNFNSEIKAKSNFEKWWEYFTN